LGSRESLWQQGDSIADGADVAEAARLVRWRKRRKMTAAQRKAVGEEDAEVLGRAEETGNPSMKLMWSVAGASLTAASAYFWWLKADGLDGANDLANLAGLDCALCLAGAGLAWSRALRRVDRASP
jgi:hypothetical protein